MGPADHTRTRSDSGPKTRLPLSLAVAVFAGAVSGVAAKMADQTQVDWLNDIGTYPAIWILIVVAISRWFRNPLFAAAHTATFYIVMVGGYYLYAHQILGFGIATEETIWFPRDDRPMGRGDLRLAGEDRNGVGWRSCRHLPGPSRPGMS